MKFEDRMVGTTRGIPEPGELPPLGPTKACEAALDLALVTGALRDPDLHSSADKSRARKLAEGLEICFCHLATIAINPSCENRTALLDQVDDSIRSIIYSLDPERKSFGDSFADSLSLARSSLTEAQKAAQDNNTELLGKTMLDVIKFFEDARTALLSTIADRRSAA